MCSAQTAISLCGRWRTTSTTSFFVRRSGRLPEREKQIVSMRFGLGGRQEKTQKEVADIMGISQSYISRLEKRIMLRLRREISRQIYS